jgi:hypothetical protein
MSPRQQGAGGLLAKHQTTAIEGEEERWIGLTAGNALQCHGPGESGHVLGQELPETFLIEAEFIRPRYRAAGQSCSPVEFLFSAKFVEGGIQPEMISNTALRGESADIEQEVQGAAACPPERDGIQLESALAVLPHICCF